MQMRSMPCTGTAPLTRARDVVVVVDRHREARVAPRAPVWFGVDDDPGAPIGRSVLGQIAHLPSEALSIDPWDGIVDRWG